MSLVRAIIFCIPLFASWNLLSQESSALVLQALEKLQTEQREEAIPLLEKAFQSSQDSEELYRIANMLTELLPVESEKREDYLLYLIQFRPQHLDYPRWLTELGDFYFSRAEFEKAEEWYLRAAAHGPDLKEKMAWLKWNQGKNAEAFELFLRSLERAKEYDSQVVGAMASIWIEVGRLPEALRQKLNGQGFLDSLIEEVYRRLSLQSEGAPIESLKQIFEWPGRRDSYFKRALQIQDFPNDPCLPFREALYPVDISTPIPRILDCAEKSDPKLNMSPYFEVHQTTGDESFLWARSELLFREGKVKEAFKVALQAVGNNRPEFLDYLFQLFTRLEPNERVELIASTESQSWSFWMRQRPEALVFESLQTHDANTWIPFEESILSQPLPTSFLRKKAAWLSREKAFEREELRSIRQQLESRTDLEASEKSFFEIWRRIDDRAQEEISVEPVFNEAFVQFFQAEDQLLREAVLRFSSLPKWTGEFARPLFLESLERASNRLEDFVWKLQLPEEMSEISETFEERRQKMVSSLRKRLLELSL